MTFAVENWFDTKIDGEILFSFKGNVTSNVINSVLEEINPRLDAINEDSKIRRKLYNAIVESFQNLFHHSIENVSDKNDSSKKFAIFVISKTDDNYVITTGNYVSNERIRRLKDRIEQINSLTTEELKMLYRVVLNNEEFSEKGGGGLGMIDIVKKTKNKLKYFFFDINDFFSFFTLKITI